MKHTESSLQVACVQWFRLQYPNELLFAIPNGGARNAVTGAILKREGVTAGVPDLFLATPNMSYHGLFIEMKTQKTTTSARQKVVIEQLKKQGYAVDVCHSFEEFRSAIAKYLNNRI